MRAKLIIFILTIIPTIVFGDISEHYYLLKASITNSNQISGKEFELYITQGQFSKIVKTDKHGNFEVKVKYLKPCLSGGNKKYTDSNMLKLAKSYNGEKLQIYCNSANFQITINETWLDYYLNLKNKDEITSVILDTENSIQLAEISSERTEYETLKEKIEDTIETIKQREISNKYNFNSKIEDLKFLIDNLEFKTHKLEIFLIKTGINKSNLIPNKNNIKILEYRFTTLEKNTKYLEIKLAENGAIEEIKIRYGS